MNFDIVRRNAAWIRFEKDVRTDTVSHAYLVCGEDDDLRASFLTLACLRILCPTACGECDTCRTILNGNHPEIIRLDGNDKIKVEDLKAVTDELYIRPAIGDKKIFIIDNADLLSPQVQNKLLKTYEEPPAYLIIFLAAKHENSLLQTVRSRGKKLYLEDVPTALIAQELVDNGENEETAEIAAAFSMGNYSKAEKFCQEEKYREQFEKTFDMMASLKKSSQVPEFAYSGLFEKDTVKLTYDFMEIILCDVLKKVTNSNVPTYTVNRDYDLKRAAEGFSPQSAAMAINAVNEARQKLSANMNSVSVSGNLLMSILEGKYKWKKRTV